MAGRVELHMVLSFCFDNVFRVSCPVNVALVVSRVFFWRSHLWVFCHHHTASNIKNLQPAACRDGASVTATSSQLVFGVVFWILLKR